MNENSNFVANEETAKSLEYPKKRRVERTIN